MRPCLRVVACSAAIGAPALATDVYNNTTTPLNTFHVLMGQGATTSPERGTTVTLAGTDRWVTMLWLKFRISGVGAAGITGVVRLYANDGAGGVPRTLLWTSNPATYPIDSGGDTTYVIRTPGVLVPDQVTVTFEVTNRVGDNFSPLGPAQYSPATLGTPHAGVWEHVAGAWSSIAPAEPPWGLRVITCYANCDGSTSAPALNVADFSCFLMRFAAGDRYANCDASTTPPALNIADFTCFLTRFAAGCS